MKTYIRNDKEYSFDEIKNLILPKSYEISQKNNKRGEISYNMINWENISSVLDIGCETGVFLSYINYHYPNIELFGVDCNINSIEIAKDVFKEKKIDFRLINCDNKLPYEDNKFNLITFFEVLEHVRSVESFLIEVKRVLRKNGYICLSVPNALWWRNNLKHMLINKKNYASKMEKWPEFTPDQRDHVNSYDFITLYRILNLNGFKLKSYGYADNKFTFLNKFKFTESLCSNIIMYLQLED